MTTIYFAGGEDSDFIFYGQAPTVDTTSGHFRSTYSRCGLSIAQANSSGLTNWAQNPIQFSASDFWFGAQAWRQTAGGSNTNRSMVRFADSSGIDRFSLEFTGSSTFGFFKINSAGTKTQLGSNFSFIPSTTIAKYDIHIHDNASGTVDFYFNGSSVFSYSGDTTTDGVSTIALVRLQNDQSQAAGGAMVWSEVIVSDSDTRSMSLQTLAPVANGNTHNFDTGSPAAANVNETTLSDATLDGSTTAGQIDQYTIPSIAAGSYSILAVGVSARLIKGSSGPSKMDLGVRSGGSDYVSSDQSLTTSWALYQNWWTTDPNTSAAWAALPTNIGLKSVT